MVWFKIEEKTAFKVFPATVHLPISLRKLDSVDAFAPHLGYSIRKAPLINFVMPVYDCTGKIIGKRFRFSLEEVFEMFQGKNCLVKFKVKNSGTKVAVIMMPVKPVVHPKYDFIVYLAKYRRTSMGGVTDETLYCSSPDYYCLQGYNLSSSGKHGFDIYYLLVPKDATVISLVHRVSNVGNVSKYINVVKQGKVEAPKSAWEFQYSEENVRIFRVYERYTRMGGMTKYEIDGNYTVIAHEGSRFGTHPKYLIKVPYGGRIKWKRIEVSNRGNRREYSGEFEVTNKGEIKGDCPFEVVL